MTDSLPFPKPPQAQKRPIRRQNHGDVRVDNYDWLRQRDETGVIVHLEAENEYTRSTMHHTEPLQERLYQEMRGRIPETDATVPVRIDGYLYYRRFEAGGQFSLSCRRLETMDAPEEVLLDENVLAEGNTFMRVGAQRVSPNHRYLAYIVDELGGESFTLFIKDLESGKLLADRIEHVYYGLEWGNDSQTLFYTKHDVALRPDRLYRHRLGARPAEDELVFHEPDASFFLTLRKTRSKAYLLFALRGRTTGETWAIPADRPDSSPMVVEPRRQGIEYTVDHHSQHFIIVTNKDAQDFRVMFAPVANPGHRNWQERIPHQNGVKIDSVEPFRHHLVVCFRQNGLEQLRVVTLTEAGEPSGDAHTLDFPDPVYTVRPQGNPEFESNTLRFSYASLTTPESVYDLDMENRTRTLRKQQPVLGGYEAKKYESQRLWTTAADGAQIPISLVYRSGIKLDGNNPLLLYGYGAYGVSIDPGFDANRVSLLDRGFVYAIAHIRGGGEMGRAWYANGKLIHKVNTFTDFIACAENVVAAGYTAPSRLVVSGRSAGGLLMGAVTNMRPELFSVVVAGVPFVDVVNTMLDPSIPLTVNEYEEWGNPNEQSDYMRIKSYSPYDNIEAKEYPHILATAGLNDPRVQYWEPAKWVAKLRAHKTDSNRLLLKTNMTAGHAGASGRYNYLREVAFEYAFMLDCCGIVS